MTREKFIITGGKRNSKSYSMDHLSECYEAGIYEIDFSRKSIQRIYIEPKPDYDIYTVNYSLTFRSGCIVDNCLYTCTHSEIIFFDLDTFTVKNRFTHPLFNDLHHVVAFADDKILFASTGIDHVGEFTQNTVVKLKPVLESHSLKPIDKTIDYRNVSTKPHIAHPNHVFRLNGDLWATRFNQMDAVCINDLNKTIKIPSGKPHDGSIQDGRLFFTTVNGMVVSYDIHNMKTSNVYNISASYRTFNPGWCRSLSVDGDYVYVGFSAFRWTYHLENMSFIGNCIRTIAKKLSKNRPARIVKYDIRRKKIVDEMLFENGDISLIFSILTSD